jgi:dTDP-4-amino-4,6-dideoxygalactose transaminase
VRGSSRIQKLDGIYRAELRGSSTQMNRRRAEVAQALASNVSGSDRASERLIDTRSKVNSLWHQLANRLNREGHADLAQLVRDFSAQMPSPLSEHQQLQKDSAREKTERARSR